MKPIAVIVTLMLSGIVAGCGEPYTSRLCTCQDKHVQCAFTCPMGHEATLLIAVPLSSSNAPFAGDVLITTRQGQPVCKLAVDSQSLGHTASLEPYGLGADIVEPSTGSVVLQGGVEYVVSMDFTQPPPTGSAVWLSWES